MIDRRHQAWVFGHGWVCSCRAESYEPGRSMALTRQAAFEHLNHTHQQKRAVSPSTVGTYAAATAAAAQHRKQKTEGTDR